MTPSPVLLRWYGLIVFVLFLLPAGNAIQPQIDVDTWWHLRVGDEILQQRRLPEVDTLTRFSLADPQPWIAYSWLHEVLLATIHAEAGLYGILIFRVLLVLLTQGMLVYWAQRGADRLVPTLVALALMIVACNPLCTERPWHFTILFTAWTIVVVDRCIRTGPRLSDYHLAIIYVLWANLHIQFVIGLGVISLGIGVAWLHMLLGRNPTARFINTNHLGRLLAVVVLATLVNPYTWQVYRVVFEYATQQTAMDLVTELQPPDWWKWYNWALGLLLIAAWGRVVWSRLPLWPTAILLVATLFSLRMQRDIWFAAFVAAWLIARPNLSTPGVVPSNGSLSLTGVMARAFGAGMLMLMLSLIFHGRGKIDRQIENVYPVRAVRYLKEHPQTGPLYNDFNWGGYLSYTLPEHPVSIDGRTNLHGEDRLRRSVEVWLGALPPEDDPDFVSANLIIANGEMPLTATLRADVRWRVVYEDVDDKGKALSVVFIRVE